MIIKITVNDEIKETVVEVSAKTKDEANSVLEKFRDINQSVIGKLNDESTIIYYYDIYYFENIDKKTYVYTKNLVYEITKWLNEIEEKMPCNFFRCSKSAVINLNKVKSFHSSFGGKITVLLINNEQILVSRKYVKEIKEKLKGGIKK